MGQNDARALSNQGEKHSVTEAALKKTDGSCSLQLNLQMPKEEPR